MDMLVNFLKATFPKPFHSLTVILGFVWAGLSLFTDIVPQVVAALQAVGIGTDADPSSVITALVAATMTVARWRTLGWPWLKSLLPNAKPPA